MAGYRWALCAAALIASASTARAAELVTLAIPVQVHALPPEVSQLKVDCVLTRGLSLQLDHESAWLTPDANGDYDGYASVSYFSEEFKADDLAHLHDGAIRYSCNFWMKMSDGKIGYPASYHFAGPSVAEKPGAPNHPQLTGALH